MTIKILGSGCPNCQTLINQTKEAIAKANLKDVIVEHVSDINQIIEYGVMSVPALIVDEEIKSTGRIPSVEEILAWLQV